MLADKIPNSVTKENGTNSSDVQIPIAAMLHLGDAIKLRKLIKETVSEV